MDQRRAHFRTFLFLGVIFFLISFVALYLCGDAIADSLQTDDCLECHGSDEITQWSADDISENTVPSKAHGPYHNVIIPKLSPFVDGEKFTASIHGELSCTDCHTDVTSIPHKRYLASVVCSSCHEEIGTEYRRSMHSLAREEEKIIYAPACSDCHGAHYISSISNPKSPVYYSNLADTCGRCHGNPQFTKKAGISLSGAFALYEKSIHGRAIQEKGLNRAANCVDCHGSHTMLGPENPRSSIFRKNIPATCGKCHYGVYVAYRDSVHGVAAAKGIPDAPVCTDCHGEHEIAPPEEKASYVSPMVIVTKTCPRCHDMKRVVGKFGIRVGRAVSYERSYHGLALKMGNYKVANCASCHGAHGIYPSSDKRSMVYKGNLKITCGKCHPGATSKFSSGSIHGGDGGTGTKVKHIVTSFYIWIIVLTIGFMMFHNFLDYIRKVIIIYRERKRERKYERMNRIERGEHLFLLISFFGLVVTGFALKFSWSFNFLAVGVNEFLRKGLHRIFAVIMTGVCLHHLGYIFFRAEGRQLARDMIPRFADLKDIIHGIRFYLGMEKERPRFDRFSYIEKMEYLALIWGSVVMIVTGLIMWFEGESMRVLPLWGVELATLIHFYEAILATLAIIVWHLYFVFINPDVAPMSLTWINGKISHHHMAIEHPLELERIEAAKKDKREQ